MKDVVLLFDTSCIYEIVILNYFMKFTNCDVEFCSLEKDMVEAMEGYCIQTTKKLYEINLDEVRSFIIPGGKVDCIQTEFVHDTLRKLKEQNVLIAGICAGVDVLEEAGILRGIHSTHETKENVVVDGNVITSRANGYVDFAIEVAKKLDLFENEADLKETIDFWKEYKSIQS